MSTDLSDASDAHIEDKLTLAYGAHVKDGEAGLPMAKLPDVLSVLGENFASASLDAFREFSLQDSPDLIDLEGLKKAIEKAQRAPSPDPKPESHVHASKSIDGPQDSAPETDKEATSVDDRQGVVEEKPLEPSTGPDESTVRPSSVLESGKEVEAKQAPMVKPGTPEPARMPSPLPPPEVKPPVSARSASPAGEPPKEPRVVPLRRGSIPTGSSGTGKSAFLPPSHVSSGRTSPATEASNEDVARTLAERNMKSADVTHVASEFGAHSYAVEEALAFSEHLNTTLAHDSFLSEHGYLPITSEPKLFTALIDGVLLCKLINRAVPDQIDERALNLPKPGKNLNKWEMQENANLAIGAAQSLGCKIVNIHAGDISGCVELNRQYLILGMVWQIVKIQLLSAINLKEVPELAMLLKEGEDASALKKLPPETVLIRWLNFHMQASPGCSLNITNFGSDMQSGEVYVRLLNRLDPDKCPLSLLENSPDIRADRVLTAARSVGIPVMVRREDIVTGNKRLNLAFCAQIFNTDHGMRFPTPEVTAALDTPLPEEETSVGLEEDASAAATSEATQEERMYRAWMNSMDLGDIHVSDVYADAANTVLLLKVIDVVRPDSVDWKRVNTSKLNNFKLVENANYVVKLCKDTLKLRILGIGGVDIVAQNKTLVLGILWQLLREQTVALLRSLSGGSKDIADADILKWANATIASTGKDITIASFKDPVLGNGVALLELLAAVEPRAVKPDLITAGESPEDKVLNAKYVLSVARKIGASVYCTWEDIVAVKPKVMLLLVAAIMQVAQKKARMPSA